MIDYKNENNLININEIYSLTNGAISFLKNQKASIKGSLLELNFTFKVNYVIKSEENWYNCSLSDENSQNDEFFIECKFGQPKKNDIIQTNKIKIYKLPNRESNLYFCENVRKLNDLQNNIQDNQNINFIYSLSNKEEPNQFRESLKNKNNFLNLSQDIIIKKKLDINPNSSNHIDKDKPNTKPKKYILISNLTIFTNNPVFFLKCKFKSDIKEIHSNYGNNLVQNYVFYDINGDEIQGAAFDCVKLFDSKIDVDSVYEISKAKLMKNNPKYNLTKSKSIFQLQFTKTTKIKKLEENGEFDNAKRLNQIEFIKIDELTYNKLNCIVNIIGIILEETNIIEIKKESGEMARFKCLVIGDNTLHRVNLKLWDNHNFLLEKKFSKGEIICVKNAKFRQYQNLLELYSLTYTEIKQCENPIKEKELKDFYLEHSKTTEYIDKNIANSNSFNNIQNK